MTISSVVTRNQYTTSSSLVTYNYTFRIIANTDLRVLLTDPVVGTDTPLALSTDYTVTGVNSDTGGTIVLNVAPVNGLRITIYRNTAALQPIHYVENDPFPADSHELGLDRLTTVDQTIEDALNRTIQVGAGTLGTFDTALPSVTTPAAGQAIMVKPDLSGLEFGSVSYVTGPTSSTDNAIARFDGTTGKVIQNSLATIDDSGNITSVGLSTGAITSTSLNTANETISGGLTVGTVTAGATTVSTLLASVSVAAPTAAITTVTSTTVNANQVSTATMTATGNVTAASYGAVNSTSIVNSGTLTSPSATITDVQAKDIEILASASIPGTLTFYDGAGVKYVAFQAPTSVLRSATYKLPPADGVPNQVLTTDGVGNLSWQTGVPQQPFLGTLATLADVSFVGLDIGDLFITPNGAVWSNPDAGMFSSVMAYNLNTSYFNVAETRSANINMNNSKLINPLFQTATEVSNTITAGAITTLDVSTGNVFAVDQAVDTTFSFTNASPTSECSSFTLLRRKDASGTSRAVIWPAGVKWTQGVIPTLTQTASAVDAFFFRTFNNGASWFGYPATLNFA